MYNEYEAITKEAITDFKDIESHIGDAVRHLSTKYKTIDIEHYLQQLVSTTCSETRLRKAMDMKRINKQKNQYERESQCNHTIEWFSDRITAFGGENRCTKCGYIESIEDGR